MPVNAQHPEYRKYKCRWDLVRSVVKNDAMHFIRTVDVSDMTRSNQYKQDAILTNFTSLTKSGLTGLVFRKKPKISLPNELLYLLNDCTGENISLLQFSQKVVGEVLETGRYGVLVDYPPSPDVRSVEYDMAANNKAKFKAYSAESIINWKCAYINNRYQSVLIVLCEIIDDLDDDGFEWCQKVQYRVLRLNEQNNYEQYVYNEDGEIIEYYVPTKADGSYWDEIPFACIGSENNDLKIDNIPLYDLAVLNLGHYRNSADYEESIFITGQPTLFLKGDGSLEEFKSVYPAGIKFGSRAGYYLGLNGGADLIQANPNQLADVAMKRKEEQALAIGARLIAPPGGRETAEAARIRFSSQNSALYLLTTNISIGLTQCLVWAEQFMSDSSAPVSFVLNDQFYDDSADPNLIISAIQMMDKGVIAKDDLRDYARRTGMVDDLRTNAMIEADSEVMDPANDPNTENT